MIPFVDAERSTPLGPVRAPSAPWRQRWALWRWRWRWRWLAVVLAGIGAGPGVGCAGDSGPAGTPVDPLTEVSGWVAASAAVLPAVHSVWGTVPALEGTRWVHAPLGTAVSIREDGILLTNAHVVAREDGLVPKLRVLVQSDSGPATYDGEVLAVDVERDLALVRIGATGLSVVRWTEEESPMGAPLATIGYGLPEGGIVDTTAETVTTRFTVFRRFTAGHSSGYRTLVRGDPATNVLEVDLFLFPGVSGGPAFRPDGRLVGVNRGHLQFREGATSYGQVIPTQVVRDFLEEVAAETGLVADSMLAPWEPPPTP